MPGARREASARSLYVEDNPANVILMQRVFALRPEVELVITTRASEALAAVQTGCFELILLDLNLPDMSGDELLGLLRSDPALAKTAIVVVSADAIGARTSTLEALGATAYLTKPFDLDELLAVIDRYCPSPHA